MKPREAAARSKASAHRSHEHAFAKIILLCLTVIGALFVVYSFWHQHTERGQYNVSDTYIGENLSQSLDLKLAEKAKYSSAAIRSYQDLGTASGLHKQIFSFDVKTDGLTEYGLEVTPDKPAPPGGYPVIILLHGYSNPHRYSTELSYLGDTAFYARHGFAVFKPDLRGQGFSINQGKPDSAYYSMAYNTDVMSLISALRQTPQIDKRNINIWGHSMGAYIALRSAVLDKGIKNIFLLSGPVDSLEKMFSTYVPPSDENNTYALATRNEVFTKYGIPSGESQFWRDSSVFNFLPQIKAHVLIFVGLKDTVVPPEFSSDLDQALTKAKLSHQYFAYPDAGHSLTLQRDDIYAKTIAQLSKDNPGI